MTESKTCPDCGETKPIERFYVNSTRPDGRTLYCMTCQKRRVTKSRRKTARERREAATRARQKIIDEADARCSEAWDALAANTAAALGR